MNMFIPIPVPGTSLDNLPRVNLPSRMIYRISMRNCHANNYYIMEPMAECGDDTYIKEWAETAEKLHEEFVKKNPWAGKCYFGWTNDSGILQLTTETFDDIFKYYLKPEDRERWERDHKKEG